MSEKKLDRLRAWFHTYAESFLLGNEPADGPIRLKCDHTFRVCENMRILAKSQHLSRQETIVAETAALFHDLGRFRQYRDYNTFLDSASTDHARLSLLEMGRHRLLAPFCTEERRRIAGAVRYHNAFAVPKRAAGARRRLMLMLRDADKLDIWKVVTEYYESRRSGKKKDAVIELDLPDDDACSEAAVQSLAGGQMVRIRDIRRLNDFKLLQIGWVFDLTFPAAFALLRERGFIDRIAATLPRTEAVEKAVQTAREYAARQVRCGTDSRGRRSDLEKRRRADAG